MARKLTNGERYTFQKIKGSTAVITDSTDGAEKSNNYLRSNVLILTGSSGAQLRVQTTGTTIDPQIQLAAETDFYTIGIDNSQNNDFAISQAAGLSGLASTNTVLRIPNGTGEVHVRNDLAVTGSIFSNSTLTITPSGSAIDLDGGLIKRTRTFNGTALVPNTNVIESDSVIYVNATTGLSTKTVTLPTISAANDGRQITVVKNDSSANAVQLVRSSTNTINGATTKTANGQYESITVIANNTLGVWYILNEYPAGAWV